MKALVRKDWKEFVRDLRFVMAAGLFAVLALTALLLAADYVASYQRDVASAEAGDRQTWLNQGERNPHGAAHFANWAFRPLTATALLDPGVTRYATVAIWLEAHLQNIGVGRPSEDQATTIDTGDFSLAWILQTVLPLLILIFAAGLVAREGERGSLRLLLASNVTVGRLIVAKVVGLARTVAFVTGPLMLIALVAIALSPAPFDADQAARLGVWCISYAVYLGIFLLLGIAVSAVSSRTGRAVLLALGVWLLTVAIGPRLSGTIVDLLAPTLSAQTFWSQIERAYEQGLPGDPDADTRRRMLRENTLAEYGVETIEALPVSFSGISLDASERYGNRVFDLHFARLYAGRDQQRTLMRWASAISPLIAMQNISSSLAGTDELHHRNFARQAELHRRRVVNALNGDLIQNGAGKTFYQYNADATLWRSMPSFSYDHPSLRAMLPTIVPDLALLFLWLLGSLACVTGASHKLAKEPTW
ncbi:MAG: DUF3526 domain-containing protein [Pseudomonadota bacterium]